MLRKWMQKAERSETQPGRRWRQSSGHWPTSSCGHFLANSAPDGARRRRHRDAMRPHFISVKWLGNVSAKCATWSREMLR
jgi:hypothetical protein